MAMSGDDLKDQIKTETYAQLQSLFPLPNGMTAAEISLIQEYQMKLAEAVAYGDGPVTVSHITGNAVVNASGPDPQGGTQTVTGTVS